MAEPSPGDLVTLSGLVSAARLNGAVARVLHPANAPHPPPAGRVAVKVLEDESIVAVKKECAVLGVPLGTRVRSRKLVNGFVMQAEERGKCLLVRLDDGSAETMPSAEVEVLPQHEQDGTESVRTRLQMQLFTCADDGRARAQTATMKEQRGSLGPEERRELCAQLEVSLIAARRLQALCPDPHQRAVAALTLLELLRFSSDFEEEEERALERCDEAIALVDKDEWIRNTLIVIGALQDGPHTLSQQNELVQTYDLTSCLVLLRRVRILSSSSSSSSWDRNTFHERIRTRRDLAAAVDHEQPLEEMKKRMIDAFAFAQRSGDQQAVAMCLKLMSEITIVCGRRTSETYQRLLADIATSEHALEKLIAAHARGSDLWEVNYGSRLELYEARADLAWWMGDRQARLRALRAGHAAAEELPESVRIGKLFRRWQMGKLGLFIALQDATDTQEAAEATALLRQMRSADMLPSLRSACVVCQDALPSEPARLTVLMCCLQVVHRGCWSSSAASCPVCSEMVAGPEEEEEEEEDPAIGALNLGGEDWAGEGLGSELEGEGLGSGLEGEGLGGEWHCVPSETSAKEFAALVSALRTARSGRFVVVPGSVSQAQPMLVHNRRAYGSGLFGCLVARASDPAVPVRRVSFFKRFGDNKCMCTLDEVEGGDAAEVWKAKEEEEAKETVVLELLALELERRRRLPAVEDFAFIAAGPMLRRGCSAARTLFSLILGVLDAASGGPSDETVLLRGRIGEFWEARHQYAEALKPTSPSPANVLTC